MMAQNADLPKTVHRLGSIKCCNTIEYLNVSRVIA